MKPWLESRPLRIRKVFLKIFDPKVSNDTVTQRLFIAWEFQNSEDSIGKSMTENSKNLDWRVEKFRWLKNKETCLFSDFYSNPKNVIAGSQFTFRVQDKIEPRFWYLTMVSCRLNKTCDWVSQNSELELFYDIWLVNGLPTVRTANPFEHQFSFDQQDCAEIYFAALLAFAIVFGIQLHAMRILYTKKIYAADLIGGWGHT